METNVKQFDPQKCITEEDLADRWGITKRTLQNRRYKRNCPNFWRPNGNTVLYDLDDVISMENESFVSFDESR